MRRVASVSFGKDSLAMLLLLLEKNIPLDEVIFYNSEMEFQAIYDIRDRIKPVLEQRGILCLRRHRPGGGVGLGPASGGASLQAVG